MIYLLDTNFCIELLNKHDSRAAKKLASVSPKDIRLCSVVQAELYHGAYKSGRETNLKLVRSFLSLFESLPFDDQAADVYGQIRADLEAKGTPIGPNDTIIAAIALAKDLTLVSHNTAEFSRVPGLKLVDWQVP